MKPETLKWVEKVEDDFAVLTTFAVNPRYPDNQADRAMAIDAMRRLRRFRKAAREALGLSED